MTDRVFAYRKRCHSWRYTNRRQLRDLGTRTDYILRKIGCSISVYIHRENHDERRNASGFIALMKTERRRSKWLKRWTKRRANYYAYYTDKRWGDTKIVICLNGGGVLGEDGCVDLLKRR